MKILLPNHVATKLDEESLKDCEATLPAAGRITGPAALYGSWITGNNSPPVTIGIEENCIGLELDPLSIISNFSAAWTFLFTGDYALALDQAGKTLGLYPDCLPAWHIIGVAHLALGQHEDSVKALKRAYELSKDSMSLSFLLAACAQSGMHDEAYDLLNELQRLSEREYVPAMALSIAYMGLGDMDKSFDWLDKCFVERDSRLFWLSVVPLFQPLRSDPRFELLLRRLGLDA